MSHKIEVLHKTGNEHPRISLILLDWSCRESFHIFHYLQRQSAPRNAFEVIWVEFYDSKPKEIAELVAAQSQGAPEILDQWIVMNVSPESYYHKHAAYNVGIAAARGDIICIMDSDAFMGDNFISTLLATFDADPDIALHVDEVRNIDRRHYPFDFPPVQEVLMGACVNWNGTTTVGLVDNATQLYTRNYGACFCAKRDAVIAIGGADEHIDYMGHVCGPYDLTFRLVNAGKRELWHPTEFIYHCWHPGTDGENNYIGPHDGRNNSTRALKARATGRKLPYVENPAIQRLRLGGDNRLPFDELKALLLPRQTTETWRISEEKRQLSFCRQAYYGSRWDEAINLYNSMSAKPDSPDFMAEMARALHVLGKRNEAMQLLRAVLEHSPHHKLAHNVMGWLLLSAGEGAKALPWFDVALGGAPLFSPDIQLEALRGRANALLASGRRPGAAPAAFRTTQPRGAPCWPP